MNISFPEAIQPYIQPGTTARLVAGTFSMGQQVMRPIGKRQVNNCWIQFRNALSKDAIDDQVDVGTINPSMIANGTNQAVLLVVDVPPSANIAQEFVAYATNKQDGSSAVVCCWCPDGGYGRFIAEQDEYYLSGWLVSSVQVVKQSYTLFLGIFGMAMLTCLVTFIVPCLLFVTLPLAGFLFTKWLTKKKQQGKLIDRHWAQQNMQKWAMSLTEDGLFRTKYEQAFGKPEIAGSRL